jgi:hypothetical protein
VNQSAITNRLLVMLAGGIVSPWIDKHFGVQLTPVDTAMLIVLAYHWVAAAGQKGVAAFQLYFPPPVPKALGPTGPKA